MTERLASVPSVGGEGRDLEINYSPTEEAEDEIGSSATVTANKTKSSSVDVVSHRETGWSVWRFESSSPSFVQTQDAGNRSMSQS